MSGREGSKYQSISHHHIQIFSITTTTSVWTPQPHPPSVRMTSWRGLCTIRLIYIKSLSPSMCATITFCSRCVDAAKTETLSDRVNSSGCENWTCTIGNIRGMWNDPQITGVLFMSKGKKWLYFYSGFSHFHSQLWSWLRSILIVFCLKHTVAGFGLHVLVCVWHSDTHRKAQT